jgi:hypothetical protein
MATKVDLARLNKRISSLSNVLAKLGKGTDAKDLILIIKRPGWTTPAELAFTHAMLEVADLQARGLAATMAGLKGAAGKVARESIGGAPRKAAAKKRATTRRAAK